MKKNKKFLIWFLIFFFVLVFILFPLPYYLEVPGSAQNVSQFIKTNDSHPSDAKGHFMLVYIREMRATPLSYILSFINPFAIRYDHNNFYQGYSTTEYQSIQQYYMNNAINNAKCVAFRAAHKYVHRDYLGMYVMSVMSNSNFKDHLKIGDVIEDVDYHHFNNLQGYVDYIRRLPPYSKLILIVQNNNGKIKRIIGRTTKLMGTNQYGIGILPNNRIKVFTRPLIYTNMKGIEGPSAGLMISLQMYNEITNHNILKNRNVAGTGTINCNGQVGDVGGVGQKVVAASKAGASIFFVPNNSIPKYIKKEYPDLKTNYQEAKLVGKKIHTRMKIIPIKNFNEALSYLKNTN